MSKPLPHRFSRWLSLFVSLVLLAACSATPPPAPPPCPSDTPAKTDFSNDVMLAGGAATSDIIPVGADDPQRGNADALVTIVEFGDFQCPFCARVVPTIERVLETYGPEKVRFVWKQQPLPFHPLARPAAEMSVALMKLGGQDAFWRFYRAAFDGGAALNEERLGQLTQQTGYDGKTLGSTIAEHGRKKVDADVELASRVEARGTPTFFINGGLLSGAQPFEAFKEAIDSELAAANAALAAGTPRSKIYATRVAANAKAGKIAEEEADDRPARPTNDDKTVWAVPVDGSPAQGPADALVTIVMFTDFQCPFCSRAMPTLAAVQQQYGKKVRLVHKNNPLAFHKEAEPAAQLAHEVFAKKGNDAFWKASAMLFEKQRDLGREAYGEVAAQMGLDKKSALAAVDAHKHKVRIEKDRGLAEDLQASGTPTFFINGRRLPGAQPIEKFSAIIDEELAKAEALVKSGTPAAKVYDQIVAAGKKPTLDLEQIDVPPPGKDNPSRGPANAPVVIQLWSEFQCPFCKKVAPTLDEVEKAFPGKVRIVFRHLPLPMHPNAAPAAEASMTAFQLGGAPSFWKMHDALFEDQSKLDRQGLEATAKRIGLDAKRFSKGLDDHAGQATIDADRKLAEAKGIKATPTAVVGRYKVSGAQGISHWKRVVQKVLDEQSAAQPAAKPVAR